MKKLFFVMAAVAALLTSCSKDDTFGGPTRGKVTFEVSTPELATRYGEGITATALQYAVYDMVEDATSGKLVDTGTATLNDKHANVSIDLVEGRKYTAIFWADAGENASPYTFTPATKTVSYTNVNNLTANNEAYDAFFAYVPKEDIKVGQTVNVTLKRPFAQLRIETSDTDRAKQLGVEVVKTGITVNAYTSFNLETGAVDGQQNITFKLTDKASAPRATVGGADYDLISMNYILANNTNADLVDVTLNFTDYVNGTEESYVRKYSKIDVQRNYRTIVRGTILTDPTEFDVTVSEGFDGTYDEDGNTSETLVVSTADEIINAFANLNDNDPSNDPGTIVLGDDIDLGSGSLTIGGTSTINGKAQNSLSTNAVTRTETETPTIVIDGNNNTITSSARRVLEIQSSNINVVIRDLKIISEAVREGQNDIRGINITPNNSNVGLTLDNCTIEFADNSASDWAYAVNQTGGNTNNTITINGGEYEGANVISIWGSNNTINIDGAKLTSLYADNNTYFGVCVKLNANDSNASTGNVVSIKNTEFNGSNAIAAEYQGGNTITMENCTDNCTTPIVYQVGGTGQAKIAQAIANGWNFKLIGNIELDETLKIAKNITIDLNGKTISGTDTATPNYALIEIQPAAQLTIDDSVGTGAIELTATNDREWNAYSSVISNQRGKLTVNGGTIEHFGGTDMAYAIDNLTNTGDQKAETVINGGTVKSTYRAIRQFLNSTVAENNLTVNGGTIESTGNNKSIWMQNANNKNNPGTLVVGEDAIINSGILISYSDAANDYISASVAAEALKDGSEVLLSKAPEIYAVVEEDGVYKVIKVVEMDDEGNYHISMAAGLKYVFTSLLNTSSDETINIIMDDDIDLKDVEWPAVSTHTAFVLDGSGHSIKNLTTNAVEEHGFSSTAMITSTRKAATIKNVTFDNANITGKGGDNSHGAVLVACNYADLTIEGVTVKNSTVSNCDRSAILTTYLYFTSAKVKDCVVEECTIEGIGTCGAILGMNNSHNFEMTNNQVIDSTISSSEGSNKAGIFIGTWQDAGTLTESNNTHSGTKAINAGEETNNEIGRHA